MTLISFVLVACLPTYYTGMSCHPTPIAEFRGQSANSLCRAAGRELGLIDKSDDRPYTLRGMSNRDGQTFKCILTSAG